jgi:hypothetical protein
MKKRCDWPQVLIGCFLLVFMSGCTAAAVATSAPQLTPTATPKPPSCDEVEGVCMELFFDGQSCLYDGPENIKTGPVTLIFLNNSDGFAADEFLRLSQGYTIQDLLDYVGEQPTIVVHPPWTTSLMPKAVIVRPGGSDIWKGILEPGIHAAVCASTDLGMWLGGSFTVEQ